MSEKNLRIARYALIGLGLVLLVVNIVLGDALNITLPLVFLMLGAGFWLLVYAVSPASRWGGVFYIPAALLGAFGLIFLVNVVSADWDAWAYAWLLLVAGAGVGVALAARQMQWPALLVLIGVSTAAGGVTLFALFGVIAGGLFIRIIAPVLLVLGGLALFWMKPEWLPLRRPPAGLDGAEPAELKAAEPAEPLVRGESQAQAEAALVEAALVEPVSPRELEVLRLIDQGYSNAEIADKLVLAQSTVKSHINSLYGKLGVQTRVQALNRARDLGLI